MRKASDGKYLILHESIPDHVAIIMDGNGRWAKEKKMPRLAGHREGIKSIRSVARIASQLGIKYLTLYAFSTENWNRPVSEVSGIMRLMVETAEHEIEDLKKNSIRFNVIGDLNKLSDRAKKTLKQCIDVTKDNLRMILTLAINYGSRWEITKAVREISEGVVEGNIKPSTITEAYIEERLCTKDMPSPDLLIRTGGNYRLSNFLLWQIAYSELYISDTYWPDFRKDSFLEAIQEYQKRERRFGKTSEQIGIEKTRFKSY